MPGFQGLYCDAQAGLGQSLHTTVIGKSIRLRFRLLRSRCTGLRVRAHWRYKQGPGSGKVGQEALDNSSQARQLLDWRAIQGCRGVYDSLKTGLIADEVLCSPKGDVISLPKKSTQSDFAYNITAVSGTEWRRQGQRAHHAVVLRAQNGDIVEILASEKARTFRDWLKMVDASRVRRSTSGLRRKCVTEHRTRQGDHRERRWRKGLYRRSVTEARMLRLR